MSSLSVSAVLAGRVPLDEVVTINGWVRTRRDSKAGFSFLALSDGSCFDSIQIVAANSLPNYSTEILQVTTGCAVTCTGKLVRSQGKGQAIEMQAERVQVLGWVEVDFLVFIVALLGLAFFLFLAGLEIDVHQLRG